MSDYFDRLAARLGEHGVGTERSRALLDDLVAHTAESGTDPEEEFGPVDEFAAALVPEEETRESGPDVLLWSADAFEGPARLNEMGAQGWEVERVDRLGRFVSRRDPERPQTWEYRQELSSDRGDRQRLTARLAPGGWEPCGHWSVLAYFKRPGSVTAGPAAELSSPPAPGRRRFFLGVRGAVTIGVSLVIAVIATLSVVDGLGEMENAEEWAGTAVGLVVGALFALGVVWGVARLATVLRDRN